MTDDCAGGSEGNYVVRDIISHNKHCNINWKKSFGDIEDQHEHAPTKTRLSNCVGGGGVTRARVTHIHIFDITRDPNGKRQRAREVTEDREEQSPKNAHSISKVSH